MQRHSLVALGLLATAVVAPAVHAADPEPVPTPVTTPAPEPPPVVTPPPAEKPKPSWTDSVQFGGKVYLGWMGNFSEGADNANTFDVTRAYLFAKAKLADKVKARVTIDAPNREFTVRVSEGTTTVSNNSGRLDVVLKHAFLQIDDVGTPGLSLKLGMQDLPWIPYEEGIYGFRFLGPLMLDREGYMSSADLGIGLQYDLPAKWFSLGLALINGETWSKPEVSAHKDVQARVTVSPVTGDSGNFRISAFVNYGEYDKGDDSTRFRVGAQLAWESKYLCAAALFALGSDRASALTSRQPSLASVTGLAKMQGISAFAWLDTGLFDVAEGLRFLVRFDMLDPDTDTDDNSHTRETLGVGYKLNSNFQAMLNLELTQNDAAAAAGVDQTLLFLNTELSF